MVAAPVDPGQDEHPERTEHPGPLEHGVRERYATTSPELATRLEVRRGRVGRLRRRLMAADLLVTVAAVLVLLGHPAAQLAAVAVSSVAVMHALAAESSRGVVAVRPLGRAVVAVVGAFCVVLALAGGDGGWQVLTGAVLGAAALTGVRLVVRAPRLGDRFGLGHRRRLIVGDPQALERAAARRTPAVEAGEVILVVTRAAGAEDDSPDQDRRRLDDAGGPSGMVERVVRTALDNAVERVTVIPGLSWQQPQLRELSWLLERTGIDMVISTNLDGIAPHRVDVVKQEGRLMIRVGSGSPRGARALAKGLVDRLAAAMLLTLSAPFLLAIAVAIRLDSPGPAVFRQTRVRERGETFTMFKFRTMRVGAEQQLEALREENLHGEQGPLFKMEDDPRITRLGRLLRSTSLDELPQLVNVLQGQMSLIGPRPALPSEVERYDHTARRRLAVKPGMTGLWQVSGRSRLSWEQSIGYDLDYVDNWSPVTDAAIAMRTFRAVMGKDGAF